MTLLEQTAARLAYLHARHQEMQPALSALDARFPLLYRDINALLVRAERALETELAGLEADGCDVPARVLAGAERRQTVTQQQRIA
jgi:hypothetical protein